MNSMRNTILIDFDGVIRHWTGKEIEKSESQAGVDKGSLLSVAFSPEFLSPAIEGKITHEEWAERVERDLQKRFNRSVALTLMVGWKSASWEIDRNLLNEIRAAAPLCKLVLVTNATTRLSLDLVNSGLDSKLDMVINSAEIGYAKPNIAFYEKALDRASTSSKQSIFIDDSLLHVEAARSLGIDSIQHRNNSDTIEFVRQNFT